MARLYAHPALYDRLAGVNAVASSPDDLDAFFRKEAVCWDKAFRESGIQLE